MKFTVTFEGVGDDIHDFEERVNWMCVKGRYTYDIWTNYSVCECDEPCPHDMCEEGGCDED